MIVTQDCLIKQIAEKEDIDIATVRKVLKSAEGIVFDYLSSTTPPDENIIIKIFSCINLKRKYIKNRKYSKGMFQDVNCDDHISVKANVSKYYSKKVNDRLFCK